MSAEAFAAILDIKGLREPSTYPSTVSVDCLILHFFCNVRAKGTEDADMWSSPRNRAVLIMCTCIHCIVTIALPPRGIGPR